MQKSDQHKILSSFLGVSLLIHAGILIGPAQNQQALLPQLGTRNLSATLEAGNRPAIKKTQGKSKAVKSKIGDRTAAVIDTPTETARDPVQSGQDSINQIQGKLTTALSRYLHYPALARSRGWEGDVIVRIEINASGNFDRVQLIRSSGYEILDQTTLVALNKLKRLDLTEFNAPGKRLTLTLPVSFKLRDSTHGA